MDEILQKLLASELLSEDARAEISSQWTNSVESFKKDVRESVTMEVRNEFKKLYNEERDVMVENIDKFVATKLVEEVAELKEDIERFRDLEAEFALKLVEEKQTMAKQLGEELDELVDKMDQFFEQRLKEEFEELKEDLDIVKQNRFGRKIFEAFASEFTNAYAEDETTVQSQLAVTEAKLKDAENQLAKVEAANAKMVREATMSKVLAPLTGKKREQMEFVLQAVETSRLEEAYKQFITRVMKEDAPAVAKPAAKPLTEAKNVVKTGDASASSAEQVKPADKQNSRLDEIRRLAGIK